MRTRFPPPIVIAQTAIRREQLGAVFSAVTNGSGVFAGFIPFDPSATLGTPFNSVALFPEYTSFASIYGQVKAVQMDIRMVPTTQNETKGDTNEGLAIASNLQVASAPTGYTDVADNRDCQLWSFITDNSGRERFHSAKHRPDLQWASTTNPVPTSTQYVGCPGSILFYGSSLPVSLKIMLVMCRVTYLFTDRT